MRHNARSSIACLLLALACSNTISGCGGRPEEVAPTTPPAPVTTTIRVGWQTAWAVQGQMTEALKQTDILAKNGLRGEFIGFPSGPPAIEAALAGNLDVVSCGSQPALQLASRDTNWVIIGRNSHVRYAILVPPDSTIRKVSDLKGKRIGTPVGSSGERYVLIAAKGAGLAPDQFEVVNLGIEEQGEFVRAGTKESWGEIAAIATWEPTVSLLVDRRLARVITDEKEINPMVMSRKFIKEHPEAAVAFVRSVLEAWAYYAGHKHQIDQMFLKDTSLPLSEALLQDIAKIEPNAFVDSPSKVDTSLTPEIIERLRSTCDFLSKRGAIPAEARLESMIDMEIVRRAEKSLPGGGAPPKE